MAKAVKEPEETQKTKLEKELKALIPEIQEEGLLFLIQQANTIIHNQRSVMIQKEMAELNQKKGKAVKVSSPESRFEIEISRSADGKTYYLTVNGRKHFMDITETKKIVDLCYRPPTKTSALKYLYQFFQSERDEILLDHKIRTADSPFFEALFKEVRSVFTLDK